MNCYKKFVKELLKFILVWMRLKRLKDIQWSIGSCQSNSSALLTLVIAEDSVHACFTYYLWPNTNEKSTMRFSQSFTIETGNRLHRFTFTVAHFRLLFLVWTPHEVTENGEHLKHKRSPRATKWAIKIFPWSNIVLGFSFVALKIIFRSFNSRA